MSPMKRFAGAIAAGLLVTGCASSPEPLTVFTTEPEPAATVPPVGLNDNTDLTKYDPSQVLVEQPAKAASAPAKVVKPRLAPVRRVPARKSCNC